MLLLTLMFQICAESFHALLFIVYIKQVISLIGLTVSFPNARG